MNLALVTNRGEKVEVHELGKVSPIVRPDPPKPEEYIQVMFSRDTNHRVKGKVTLDTKYIPLVGQEDMDLTDDIWWENETHLPTSTRKKIVFVFGWYPERLTTWQGPLPKDGEEWLCEIVRDTEPSDPMRGALVVKLVENITQLKKDSEMHTARKQFGPIVDFVSLGECAHVKERAESARQLKGLRSALKFFQQCLEGPQDGHNLAAIAWLNYLLNEGTKPGKFEYLAKRNFRCIECGGINRVDKSLLETIKTSEGGLPYACAWCGAKGNLKV